MVYVTCVALGMLLVVFLQNALLAISERLNNGKKIYCDRRHAGYLISCRFNGSKRYFFVDHLGNINRDGNVFDGGFFPYFEKKEAIEACQEAYRKTRPKSTTFARIA